MSPATLGKIQQLIVTLQESLSDLSSSISHPSSSADRDHSFAPVQAGFGALEAEILHTGVLLGAICWSYLIPIALGLVVRLGFPEVVSAAGDKGISSVGIEERTGVPQGKVSRLLRSLTGQGIFFNECVGELRVKTAVAVYDAFRDPTFVKSYEPNGTGFNKYIGTSLPFWGWIQSVDDGVRVGSFMKCLLAFSVANTEYGGYSWQHLGPNATLVDVGGSVGTAMLSMIPHAPNVTKIVIQDLREVIESPGVKEFWNARNPEYLSSGRVQLQVADFFKDQPVKGAQAYFLRYVLHEKVRDCWSDEKCVTILKHLHSAANAHSRLLVAGRIIEHACHDLGGADANAVEGAYELSKFPAPLPTNGGRAAKWDLQMDLHMMAICNGQERACLQLVDVAGQAGWKPKKVYSLNASTFKISEFVKE
ncbi:hypothetical protein FRB96_007252 [Tulasnella sp. 330]|nr:hypothetical protein FRB96_007252 [Tulasnella sp. 330]